MKFLNHIYDEHNLSDTVPILNKIPQINMIDYFSINYMHLVHLGIVKILISLWLGIFNKAPIHVYLEFSDVN